MTCQRYIRHNVQSSQIHQVTSICLTCNALNLEEFGGLKQKIIYTVQNYSKNPLFNYGKISSCERMLSSWIMIRQVEIPNTWFSFWNSAVQLLQPKPRKWCTLDDDSRDNICSRNQIAKSLTGYINFTILSSPQDYAREQRHDFDYPAIRVW